ncbi:MAG: MarR family transcriptional regulator [Actinobacteria bacterium]|nr:MarR family transcriptional regulator [Actinomycetota bacterium]
MPTQTKVDPKLVSGLRLSVMRLARRLRQQATGDITPSMISALHSVEALGPIPLGELAQVEKIQPPTMTLIVNRLDDQGLIKKDVDASDRRITRISISVEGKKFLGSHRSRKDAYLARALEELSDHELAKIEKAIPILEKLLEATE